MSYWWLLFPLLHWPINRAIGHVFFKQRTLGTFLMMQFSWASILAFATYHRYKVLDHVDSANIFSAFLMAITPTKMFLWALASFQADQYVFPCPSSCVVDFYDSNTAISDMVAHQILSLRSRRRLRGPPCSPARLRSSSSSLSHSLTSTMLVGSVCKRLRLVSANLWTILCTLLLPGRPPLLELVLPTCLRALKRRPLKMLQAQLENKTTSAPDMSPSE